MKSYRTSRFAMYIRGLILGTLIFGSVLAPFVGYVGYVYGGILTFLVWTVLCVVGSIASKVFCDLWYGTFQDDEQYHALKLSGGHPFWDVVLPWPINPDSQAVRGGGLPEPNTKWTPPESYRYQCYLCGARNPDPYGVCWNCHADYSDPDNVVIGNDTTYWGVGAPIDEGNNPLDRPRFWYEPQEQVQEAPPQREYTEDEMLFGPDPPTIDM